MAATDVIVTQVPGGVKAEWPSLAGATTGLGANLLNTRDKTFQASGTFGSATVKPQGSNDGTNWFDLTDGTSAVSLTSAGGKRIVENPLYVRVVTSGGTGSAIVATIVGASR